MSEGMGLTRTVSTVQEAVYDALKKGIMTLKLEPGCEISTQEMASRLNVSRTPVREAFIRLQREGLVDEDVDLFDTNDVLWAMNTRFQGDADIITIPGVRCHPLDPSSNPAYTGSIRDVGCSTKTIFDCTVPFELKDHFHRAPFLEVDPKHWLPDLEG